MSTAPALAPSQLIMRVSHFSPPPPPTTLLDMATPTQLLREVLAALAAFRFMLSFMARCLCLCRSLPGMWLGGMGENVKVEEEVDAEESAVCGLLEDVEDVEGVEDVEDVEEVEEIEEAEDVVEEMVVEEAVGLAGDVDTAIDTDTDVDVSGLVPGASSTSMSSMADTVEDMGEVIDVEVGVEVRSSGNTS